MAKSNIYLPLLPMFQKYVAETIKGRRLQKNGKQVSRSTIQNYEALLMNLEKYSNMNNEAIEINIRYRYSRRIFVKERKFYQKFYLEFTDYLYAKGCIDNYVGLLIKTLRSFFIYLNDIMGYETGNFYRFFYIRREEIPVVVLSQSQLQFLIQDEDFQNSIDEFLQKVKDVFVFGCTVGLRFSDLIRLRKHNLENINGKSYLIVKSIKTDTETRIKLPEYAIQIINKYRGKQKTLLPEIPLTAFNNNIKKLATLAGWTYEVGRERSKRGVRHEIKKDGNTYRFCDLVSSHIMRRTAITTLLVMGMPEPLVRIISGHAVNSKEFYKYVKYSESFQDEETDKAFDRLLNSTRISLK